MTTPAARQDSSPSKKSSPSASSLTGVFTALVTPFREDGSLDEPGLRRLVKRQIRLDLLISMIQKSHSRAGGLPSNFTQLSLPPTKQPGAISARRALDESHQLSAISAHFSSSTRNTL